VHYAAVLSLAFLQVPGTWQKGREALKALLQHYRQPQVSSQLSPLPFPNLTPGRPPTQEQLVQLMAAAGAIVLHAYVTMYVCRLAGHASFKQEALRQLDAGGAALFLEAAHQVVTAAVTAGAQHGSSQAAVLVVSKAIQEAASKLPAQLLREVRALTQGMCMTVCWPSCTCSTTWQAVSC
jgi:hypothetical protein